MAGVAPSGPRVLLVDDEADVRELLALALGRAGFTVEHAADGVEALGLLERGAPDAIVTDLGLPGYGGFELVRRLRAAACGEGTGDLPVIVITGKYTDPSLAELVRRESGADEFLAKPVDPEAVVAAVRRAVAARAARAGAGQSMESAQ